MSTLSATATYDKVNNLLTNTDTAGTVTSYTYDASNTLLSVTQPIAAMVNSVTSYGYDANGNNTRVTDGNGNIWQTTYNSWGLVESRIEPATTAYPNVTDRTFTTRYDGGGLPVLELQPGVNVTRTFDNLGRLTGESTADGANRGFTYDLANRPTTVTSGATSISLGYNEHSQLVSASGSAGASSFRYDQVGRPTQRVDAAGTTSYSWRQNGQLNQAGDPVTGTTSTYNWAAPLAANAGQLTSVSTSATARSYGYDGIGRVVSDVMTAGASTLWSASYHYDSAGHVDTKTIGPAGVAGAGANSYGYSLAGQLTSWTDPASVATAYSYDLAGNRTSNGATAIVFDQRNRIVSEGTKSYAWAARGTLDSITDGASTTSYAFDGLGRMTAADGVSYSYDGLNRIINRDSTAFTYSGVHNQPTSDGTTVLSRTPDGSPLAIAEGATRLTLLADRHGDVVASMTAAGVLVDSVAYSPWGEPAARQGATALTVGFQSSYTDPTTGLIDMGARWYQPSSGTFTNRDTYNGVLSSPISLNRYTYANNNPIDYFDPDGRMSADAAQHYAARGMKCSGTKHGVDCAKRAPTATKTADRVQRERDQAIAEAVRVEQMETQGGPGIFIQVDPTQPTFGPPLPGSGGPGTNGSSPGPGDGAPMKDYSWLEAASVPSGKPFDPFDGTHTTAEVRAYLLDDHYAYRTTLNVNAVVMDTNRDGRHRESEGWFDVRLLYARNLERRYDEANPSLSAMDNLALDVLLPWADVQSSTVCGGVRSSPVYCVGVTRLPTADPSARAMSIGHFVLLDTTDPGESIFYDEVTGNWLPTQEMLAHELTHIYRAEVSSPIDEYGLDDRWPARDYIFEHISEEACAYQVGQGGFPDSHLVEC